jgi:peptidoglycan hydrolase CwlO-like protein
LIGWANWNGFFRRCVGGAQKQKGWPKSLGKTVSPSGQAGSSGHTSTSLKTRGRFDESAERKLQSMQSKLQSMQSKLQSVQSKLQSMQSKLQSVQSKLHSVQSKLYCLQSKIAKRAIKITNHATKNLIRP